MVEGKDRGRQRGRLKEKRKGNKLSIGAVVFVQTHTDYRLQKNTKPQSKGSDWIFLKLCVMKDVELVYCLLLLFLCVLCLSLEYTQATTIFFCFLFFLFVNKVNESGDRWEGLWKENWREALTCCTEQAGSHNCQKEKQVSTIAFVALRYFLKKTFNLTLFHFYTKLLEQVCKKWPFFAMMLQNNILQTENAN